MDESQTERTLYFRVMLWNDEDGQFVSLLTQKHLAPQYEGHAHFVRWLTPWQEVQV